MTTMNLDLYFKQHTEDEAIPSHPVAQIYLKSSIGHSYPDAKDFSFLSCQCLTMSEMEHEVKRLHGELDEILKKARKKFAAT